MLGNFLDDLKKTMGNETIILDSSVRAELSKDKCPGHLWEQKQSEAESNSACAAVVKISKNNYKISIPALFCLVQKYGRKIIARGGGSGVCGALVPRQPLKTVMVDLTGLDDIFEINLADGYVISGAGILGSRLEEAVSERGHTLGHSPASLSISTPGGWVATRSSGQFSSRFGTIEDLVLGMEVFTGDGQVRWIEQESELKDFFRMEGTNGLITKVKMKIFRCLEFREFPVFSFRDVKTALLVMEKFFRLRPYLEKNGAFLSALRLYDAMDFEVISKPHQTEEKTHANLRKKEKMMLRCPQMANWLAKFWGGPVMILALESNTSKCLRGLCEEIRTVCLKNEGREENEGWGEIWFANRFKLKYEKVAQRAQEGMIIDTFDCSGSFEELPSLYEKIKSAAADLAVMGAHFGMDLHTPYIYFTFAALAEPGDQAALYEKIWSRILETCYRAGGLTTHHHGIGFLKAGPGNSLVSFAYGDDWLKNLARPAKQKHDPHNLFNPGNIC